MESMPHENIHFPEGFLWGSSIAGHQVEGGNVNDWSEWEVSEKRIADLEHRKLLERHGRKNYVSDRAAGHYERYREDFALAKELGHSALRFSIEWSRIEPRNGEWNIAELDHYRDRCTALREHGIEPFVTLWHWPVPLWVRDMGGWESKRTVEHFARYASHVASHLKGLVHFWITLNEPEVYASNSYLTGTWPPQKKNPMRYVRVLENLIQGHRAAYKEIKEVDPPSAVGIAKHNIHFEIYRQNIVNRLRKRVSDWWWNFRFLEKIQDTQDFIGVNQYFRHRLHWGGKKPAHALRSDMEWELHPDAMYDVLMDLRKYQKPIYVTENGLADAGDKRRAWFIHEIVKSLHRALEDGVDIRGYLHWSLIDNFEWDKGFWPRFGLVEIDYETLARRPRESAKFYGDIMKANGLTHEVLEKHKHLLSW